jgi:hypothetical protein
MTLVISNGNGVLRGLAAAAALPMILNLPELKMSILNPSPVYTSIRLHLE